MECGAQEVLRKGLVLSCMIEVKTLENVVNVGYDELDNDSIPNRIW